jgi:hypothetical protein
MDDKAAYYLQQAKRFEERSEAAETADAKSSYDLLAKGYRALAELGPKAPATSKN